MPKVFCQNNKIKNAVGRSDYISGRTEKQEEVVIHKMKCDLGWKYYDDYEHEQSIKHSEVTNRNAAREMIIKLDNSFASVEKEQTTEEQKKCLESLCDSFVYELVGVNHDYEYAVHWNHDRTNLHVHILFSERPIITELEPKRYVKDIWVNKDTNRLSKANADDAVLKHRKGEIILDKDGNPKYDYSGLGKKELKFKSKSYLKEQQTIIQEIFERYGIHYDIHDDRSPYLSQKKYNPHYSDEAKNKIIEYNNAVKEYNAEVRAHLQVDEEQRDNYIVVKHDLQVAISDANKEEQSLSKRAIEALKTVTNKIHSFVEESLNQIKINVDEWWEKEKAYYISLFTSEGDNKNDNTRRIKSINQFVEERKRINEGSIERVNGLSQSERVRAFRDARYSRGNEDGDRESIKQSKNYRIGSR